jgi:hypothetical protein
MKMSNWGIIIQSGVVLMSVFVGYALAALKDPEDQ